MTENLKQESGIKPRRPFVAIVALIICHVCLLVYSAIVHSPNANEPAHLAAGISHWTMGRFGLYRVNPPLVRAVAAIPVLGAWSWLVAAPLIVGIARSGGPFPVRPNEGLLLIATIGVGLGGLYKVARGERFLPKLRTIDAAMVLARVKRDL